MKLVEGREIFRVNMVVNMSLKLFAESAIFGYMADFHEPNRDEIYINCKEYYFLVKIIYFLLYSEFIIFKC